MATFFGELTGALVESFLDLIGKSKPEAVTAVEYRSEFVVKHKGAKILSKSLLSIFVIALSAVGFALTHADRDTAPLFVIFVILGVITLIPALYAAGNRCAVTEENLVHRQWFREKTVPWSDITCLRRVETTNQHSQTLALYGCSGELVFDCDTGMENAWYILKMAQTKGIEVRQEKDIPIKEMLHLGERE